MQEIELSPVGATQEIFDSCSFALIRGKNIFLISVHPHKSAANIPEGA
jgi:hypothetical protein